METHPHSIHVRLTTDEIAKLIWLSAYQDRSRSAIMRRALAAYYAELQDSNGVPANPRKAKPARQKGA